MYKALTLPRTRKQAAIEPPSTAVSGSNTLKPTSSAPPSKKRKSKRASPAPRNDDATAATSATISNAKSAASVASTSSGRSSAIAAAGSIISRSPKVAKKGIKNIIKGGRNFLFRNKNESAPIAAETSLDLRRVTSASAETPPSMPNCGGDETDVVADTMLSSPLVENSSPPPPSEDWSVKTTCERVKKMSVIESVYRSDEEDELAGGPEHETGTDVRSTTPEQDAFSDTSTIPPPTPTAELGEFSPSPSFRLGRKTSTALKEEIMRKTSCDNGAYIIAKMNSKDWMINGQDRAPSNKNDLLFKILVIGELGTGKTSIIKRYVHQFFSQHYRATIGVDFALKVLAWDGNTTIRLQLWDIAGQERFGNMTRVYYKEAVGAFIVFDVTSQGTLDAVNKWKQDLDSKVQLPDGETIPCVLLANKCDQPKEGIVNNHHKMDEFCKENHFVGWFETSAKENINIDEAANCLVSKIIQNDMKRQLEKDTVNGTNVISIDLDKKDSKKKFCRYC